VHGRLEEDAARRVLHAEDGGAAAPHRWEAAMRRHGRWSLLEVPRLAGLSACGRGGYGAAAPGRRSSCWRRGGCDGAWWLSTREEKGDMFSGWCGDVLGESPAPILSVPAAVVPRCHFSSWKRLPWSFIYTLDGCGSPGEIPSSGFPGGPWRRLCRSLLVGIVLESSLCFFYCRHGGGCRGSNPEWRTCESRRRPRRPYCATASWGG
jgi:hypothetical protein